MWYIFHFRIFAPSSFLWVFFSSILFASWLDSHFGRDFLHISSLRQTSTRRSPIEGERRADRRRKPSRQKARGEQREGERQADRKRKASRQKMTGKQTRSKKWADRKQKASKERAKGKQTECDRWADRNNGRQKLYRREADSSRVRNKEDRQMDCEKDRLSSCRKGTT